MKIFLDTASIDEIKMVANTGLIDGVTTNPSLLVKENGDMKEILQEICNIINGPISAEVHATNYNNMIIEANILRNIAENIVIKLPLTIDGLKACKTLSGEGAKINITLCFSSGQALLAAKAGADFVSPFIGRHDDIGYNGLNLIQEIIQIYSNYPDFTTEVLVASVRHPVHVVEAAMLGADIVTIPIKIFNQLIKHPLTDIGLQKFLTDIDKSKQVI